MTTCVDSGCGPDDDARVRTVCPPVEDQSSGCPGPASEIFKQAAEEIPPDLKYPFLTPRWLQNKLNKMQRQQGSTTVRLLVTGVDEASVDAAIRPLPFRRSMRVWYESDLESAIIKLLPSPMHDVTASQFFLEVASAIHSLPGHGFLSLTAIGASKFNCQGKRSKEGDAGVRCTTRTGAAAWPNLMIEVGCSESTRMLRLDAQWWLAASGGLTRMVILIKVKDRPVNSLHLEVWRFLPNPQAQRTRQAPSHMPTSTKTIKIDAAGVVAPAGALLTIPYADLFDVGYINAVDVVFTTAQISQFAQFVFLQCA